MIKPILAFLIFSSINCNAKNITLKLFEDINIILPEETVINKNQVSIKELKNYNLQSLYSFDNGLALILPNDIKLEVDIRDKSQTSKKMNSLSTLNWLTVVSAYTKMINKNVKQKEEQGYKTVSTLTGDWVGTYRAIISRLGWATEIGINNLFLADIFHDKAMLSIKVTWISDETNSEKIADQVISSIKVKLE